MDSKPGAEEAQAEGIGSYTANKIRAEAVEAKGLWKGERWHVVFKRALKVKDSGRIEFRQGKTVNTSFAVWDGSKEDRNGQKMISIWNELTVE
jgi:DMSO reductase family type II enzyme heme b subunit